MKRIMILLLALVGMRSWAQNPDPYFTDKTAFKESSSFQKLKCFIENEDYSSFDLTHQRLNFKVNPAVNYISGSVFSSLKFLKENVSQIAFDLNNVLTLDSVLYNKKRITASHQTDKITINLLQPATKGETSTVEIFYHGIPPQNGMGSFVASNHTGSPIVWTLSEPYGSKDWWPCKESLQDKIDSVDIYITCPQQYLGASNGKLIENKIIGQNNVFHWKHKYPIATYLIGIAVTNYQSYSDFLTLDNGQKMEVLNYVYPEYLATAKLQSPNILDILSFYNRTFITYPFASEKYGHAQFGWGGGMEHQTMSFMTSLDFELVAHEMAHQWFGDYITLASWHDIWLNEGFATYLTGLTYENLLDGQYWIPWKNIQVTRITANNNGSVYVADTTDINRIFNSRLSYSKGAYLLHMLRWEMGDTRFFNGLKNYLNDLTLAYGFASQEKFVKHMEAAGDTTFTEFFKDWYYGEGFPTYRIVPFVENGKQKVRISQTPSSSTVTFFEMHVQLRIWKDGKFKDIRLYNTAQNQEFTIADFQADKIEFDPDKWLIAKADIINDVYSISEIFDLQIFQYTETNSIRVLLTGQTKNAILQISDMNGHIIKKVSLNSQDTTLEVKNIPAGIYIVDVQSGQLRATRKLFLHQN